MLFKFQIIANITYNLPIFLMNNKYEIYDWKIIVIVFEGFDGQRNYVFRIWIVSCKEIEIENPNVLPSIIRGFFRSS